MPIIGIPMAVYLMVYGALIRIFKFFFQAGSDPSAPLSRLSNDDTALVLLMLRFQDGTLASPSAAGTPVFFSWAFQGGSALSELVWLDRRSFQLIPTGADVLDGGAVELDKSWANKCLK